MPLQTILMYVGIAFIAVGVVCLGLAAYMFFVRDVRGAKADLSGKGRYRGSSDKGTPLRLETKRHKAVTGSLAKSGEVGNTPKSISDAVQQSDQSKKPDKDNAAQKNPSFGGDDSSTGTLGASASSENADVQQGGKGKEALPAAGCNGSASASDGSDGVMSGSQAFLDAEPVDFTIVRKIVLRESAGLDEG